jgi:hypothetical protein
MDDRDSFYYRAIRTKLGDAPRAQYDLLPDTPTKALFELYQLERAAGNARPDLVGSFIQSDGVGDRRERHLSHDSSKR